MSAPDDHSLYRTYLEAVIHAAHTGDQESLDRAVHALDHRLVDVVADALLEPPPEREAEHARERLGLGESWLRWSTRRTVEELERKHPADGPNPERVDGGR